MSLRTSALGLGAAIVANAALVIAAIVASAAGTPSHSDLQFVTRGKSNRIVIFVDGLSGDPAKTFRWGQGVPSWPELMAADTSLEHQQLPLARYDTGRMLFVGLGNLGPEYVGNRHNIGFMVAQAIAKRHSIAPWRRKFQGVAVFHGETP